MNQKQEMLGLRTTVYKVNDLGKAKEWYTQAFGIPPYFVESFYVGFNIGGFELGLLPDHTPADKKTENVASYWGVANIEKTFDRLLSIGATEFEKPTNVGGGIATATVKDPFGNLLGIIFNPQFKTKE